MAGTEEVWERTFREKPFRWNEPKPLFGSGQVGSKRLVHQFPDEIKRLGVGEVVLVEKNPHRVGVVRVKA